MNQLINDRRDLVELVPKQRGFFKLPFGIACKGSYF